MPLGVVTAGPYRFVRHPNYVAVFVELLALPLVHGAYLTAVAGTLLHLLILRRRVSLEESVLMADEGYRRAFADKPRFIPMPAVAMAVDVVVAGGGPAGATLAILLGRAGLRVDVYDARRFPRDKPCGEGIMPGGVAVLGRLGLRDAVGGRALSAVRYHGFGLTAAAPFGVARPPGDDRPRSAAPAARRGAHRRGPRRRPACASSRRPPSRGPRSKTGAPSACASGASSGAPPWWSAPTGSSRRCGARSGSTSPRAPRRGPACGCTFAWRLDATLADNLEIFVGRGYELYAAPLPDGELLVAGLGDDGALGGSARDGARALDRRRAVPARRSRGRHAAHGAGGTRARRPPGARRVRAGRRAARRRRARQRSADRRRASPTRSPPPSAWRRSCRATSREGDRALARFDRERRRLLRPHDWLTRALVQIVRRPLLAHATLLSMRALPPVMRRLVAVAGAAGVHPPAVAAAPARASYRSVATAASSTPALAISSATAQNATLPQRAESP